MTEYKRSFLKIQPSNGNSFSTKGYLEILNIIMDHIKLST